MTPRRFQSIVALALTLLTACVSVRADEPFERLYLKSGGTLKGTSRNVDAGMLTWELPDGQAVNVPLLSVDHIDLNGLEPEPPPASPPPATTEQAVQQQLESDEEHPGVMASAHAVVVETYETALTRAQTWTKRIELGARFLDGNSNDDFIDIKGIFENETEGRSYKHDMGGNFGQSNGERAANRWYINSTVDFCKKGNWIVFFTTRNLFDEFANLDYRGTLSTGLGYRFYNEKEKRLIVRLGPGVTHEKFHAPRLRRTTPDMLAETELRWPLFDRTEVENTTTLYPSIASTDVFRMTSRSGLLLKLDNDARWQLKFGFLFNYNSQPNDNREKSDYTTNIVLVYKRG